MSPEVTVGSRGHPWARVGPRGTCEPSRPPRTPAPGSPGGSPPLRRLWAPSSRPHGAAGCLQRTVLAAAGAARQGPPRRPPHAAPPADPATHPPGAPSRVARPPAGRLSNVTGRVGRAALPSFPRARPPPVPPVHSSPPSPSSSHCCLAPTPPATALPSPSLLPVPFCPPSPRALSSPLPPPPRPFTPTGPPARPPAHQRLTLLLPVHVGTAGLPGLRGVPPTPPPRVPVPTRSVPPSTGHAAHRVRGRLAAPPVLALGGRPHPAAPLPSARRCFPRPAAILFA